MHLDDLAWRCQFIASTYSDQPLAVARSTDRWEWSHAERLQSKRIDRWQRVCLGRSDVRGIMGIQLNLFPQELQPQAPVA